MRSTYLQHVDKFTGEVYEGTPFLIPPKRKNGFREGWVAMPQHNAFEKLAKGDFGLHVHRVWHALMANVDYENIIRRSQRQIALEIGMAPQNFNRAVKQLCDEGMFIKYKVDERTELRLNPEYGWKGSSRNHVVALEDVRKMRYANENGNVATQGSNDEQD
jgi:hypothetical protein